MGAGEPTGGVWGAEGGRGAAGAPACAASACAQQAQRECPRPPWRRQVWAPRHILLTAHTAGSPAALHLVGSLARSTLHGRSPSCTQARRRQRDVHTGTGPRAAYRPCQLEETAAWNVHKGNLLVAGLLLMLAICAHMRRPPGSRRRRRLPSRGGAPLTSPLTPASRAFPTALSSPCMRWALVLGIPLALPLLLACFMQLRLTQSPLARLAHTTRRLSPDIQQSAATAAAAGAAMGPAVPAVRHVRAAPGAAAASAHPGVLQPEPLPASPLACRSRPPACT